VETYYEVNKEFRNSITQYGISGEESKLVVLRLQDPDIDFEWLGEWIGNHKKFIKSVILIIVSDVKPILGFMRSGSYAPINCVMPNKDDRVKWVQTFGLSDFAARLLLDRCAGSLQMPIAS